MNRKTLSAACLTALIGLPGCVNNVAQPQAAAPLDNTSQQYCAGGVCETDPFINYTQTRAPFRYEGELSPRDRLISQSGAGNNLSAAVPPSIEDEVISYEAQVETQTPQEVESAAQTVQTVQEEVSPVVTQGAVEVPNVQTQEQPKEQVQAVSDSASSEPVNEQPVQNENVEKEVVVAEEISDQLPSSETLEDQTDDDGEDAVRDWYAEEGQNLKALLTEWSEESGWRLVWNTNRNYVLNAGAMFRGRFADVSSALIRAFARARPAPVATFYKGNRVLVVETMEDENAFD